MLSMHGHIIKIILNFIFSVIHTVTAFLLEKKHHHIASDDMSKLVSKSEMGGTNNEEKRS